MTAPAPTTFAAVLRAELTRRCARNPSYSLRAFARALDVDHATLSQILRGRRALTRETIHQLGQRLGLEAARLEAFVRDAEAVRDGPPAYSPSLDAAAIVGDPLHHQLLALTHAEGFRGESPFLAQVLDTTPDAINVVLQRLLRFGLLRMSEGAWVDVTAAGELDPEGFERAVWDQAARRLAAATTDRPEAVVPGDVRPHPVRQFQLLARDPDATAAFYERLFGWRIHRANALGYRQISTGADGIEGGIWPTPPEGKPLVQLFIESSDLDGTVARARGLGGQVVVPPQQLPEGDALAILVDPEGRPFAVYSPGATVTTSPRRRPMDEAMRGIEALRRRDEAASKAYDVKALAELWTADAVALPPGGPVKRGPELRRGLEKMAGAARATEVLDYREVFEETLVFGDTAVEWGHIEGSERDRSTGEVTRSRFHLMRILKRVEDGSWRVHRSIFAPAG